MDKMAFTVRTREATYISINKNKENSLDGIRRPHPSHLHPFLIWLSASSVPRCSPCVSPPLQACERDAQCGFGLCCAVSLWLRGLRMCVPRGVEGDECHPFSHKVRDWGEGKEEGVTNHPASRPPPHAHSLCVSPTLVFRVTGSLGR